MTDKRPAEIAAGLTKGGAQALLRIGEDWTLEGAPGPKREGAYSLWWGRCGALKLIERPQWREGNRWAYRLTPLGLAVRAHLTNPENSNHG